MLGFTRYILGQLLTGLVLTSLGLACVLWLTQSLRFVELIVNKGLSITGFLKLTLLLMPNFLAFILPLSLFVVVLFVYNRMISDRELVVLRAAGLSHGSLARPALIVALIATVAGYVVTLWVSPLANQAFREYYWEVKHDLSTILIQEGTFNHMTGGLTVYVGRRSAAGVLEDVLVHDGRDAAAHVTIMAERGVLLQGDQGPEVLLENGNRQEISTATGRMSMLYFDRYAVQFDLASGSPARRHVDARERPLAQLLHAQQNEEFSEQEIRQFREEAHQRLTMPLMHLGLTLIALACLLSGNFNRRGQIGRVALAIGLMVLVEAGALGGSNLVTKYTRLVPLMYVNAIIPVIVGLYVLLGPPARRLVVRRPHQAAAA